MKSKSTGLFIGIAIILTASMSSWWLLRSAPVQETREKSRSAKIVQTVDVTPSEHSISVSAYGNVIAARKLLVQPEVTGRVIGQHPSLVPGGRIREGESLITLDDSDYRLALREARTTLDQARSELDVEAGRQIIARRELEQLRKDMPAGDINEALVLRQPFKASAEAVVERAETAVAKAELDLTRTVIRSPFNALVIDETVETGQQADVGSPFATLVGSDVFWIQANIPLSELKWIQFPEEGLPGAKAEIELSGTTLSWDGRVSRLLGDLEEAGRLARILIEVPKPLESNPDQPLLLGSYVRVKIEAGSIKDVIEIPRSSLHDGKRLWLVGSDEKLIIRDTEVRWRNEDLLLVTNVIKPGESLIVSDLTAPLPGMDLAPEPLKTRAADE